MKYHGTYSSGNLTIEATYDANYNIYKGRFLSVNLPSIYGDNIREVLELLDEISNDYNKGDNET